MSKIPAPDRSNCAALIVSYNASQALVSQWIHTRRAFDHVLIVDNSTDNDAMVRIKDFSVSHGVALIQDGHNKGLAAANNLAFKWLEGHGLVWIAIFDHDTKVMENIIEIVSGVYQEFAGRDDVGLFGVNLVEEILKEPIYPVKSDLNWEFCNFIIGSGTFLSLRRFKEIGPFMGSLFVAAVDVEYSLRVVYKALKIVRISRVCGSHIYGEPRNIKVFGRVVRLTNYSPFRHYLWARSLMILTYLYAFRVPGELGATWRWTLKHWAKICFESGRPEKIRAVIRGISAGLWHVLSGGARRDFYTAVVASPASDVGVKGEDHV
jgi:rhamnosyltransferase